jgi:hypothetical protein
MGGLSGGLSREASPSTEGPFSMSKCHASAWLAPAAVAADDTLGRGEQREGERCDIVE